MQIEKLTQGSEDSIQTSLPKGHLNRFMVVLKGGTSALDFLDALNDATLSVKYVGKKTTHLIPNLPLAPFIARSSQNYGYGSELSVVATHKALQNADIVGADKTNENDDNDQGVKGLILPIMIDIGSIYNEAGNETHIQLNVTGVEKHIYAVSDSLTNPHFINYDFDMDLNENHQMVNEAYFYSKNFPTNANIIVESDTENYSFDTIGAQAYTSLVTETEQFLASNLFNVFTSETHLPQDVWVKIQGIGSDAERGLFLIRETSPQELEGTDNTKKGQLANQISSAVVKMDKNDVSSSINTHNALTKFGGIIQKNAPKTMFNKKLKV